eukprot:TRINITY_DN10305_c0_g1_i1.p1 TRINITY_DN10305_c0_g1~~TRINITY_DN10305_c0_g1_i1.p1  ORF type:complete len:113 (+),score=15.92 TRINITY_DN10305_c0_g1_i1:127-465(+)
MELRQLKMENHKSKTECAQNSMDLMSIFSLGGLTKAMSLTGSMDTTIITTIPDIPSNLRMPRQSRQNAVCTIVPSVSTDEPSSGTTTDKTGIPKIQNKTKILPSVPKNFTIM